jgi:tyrosine-specific transport protein
VLFIAGNAIGAGVLGLPVALGSGGFAAAVVTCCVLYLLALGAGLMLARLFCRYHQRDLPTFFQQQLGNGGLCVFSLAFFSLFFCLLVAYWSGIRAIFANNGLWVLLLAMVVVSLLLRLGTAAISKMVGLLTAGLVVSFFLLIAFTLCYDGHSVWTTTNWMVVNRALPILFCSYGFQGAIPIVCRQMDFCQKRIDRAILYGTLIPLVFNIAILFISFRVLAPADLALGAERGLPVFLLFREKLLSPVFVILGEWFSFFAIGSSLLGVTATLSGALRDILHQRSWYVADVETLLLIALPLCIALYGAHIFIATLELAGGICLNVIAGILPCIVAIRHRRTALFPWVFLCGFVYIFLVEVCNLLMR